VALGLDERRGDPAGRQDTVDDLAYLYLSLMEAMKLEDCVVVGVSPAGTRLSLDPALFLQQRVLTGSSFGGGHQRTDVPMLLDLYMSGRYKLEELISRRVALTELDHAFDAMLKGEVKRSVVVYT